MMVSVPVKPSARSVSAALRPASEAPTITMCPRSVNARRASLMRVLHRLWPLWPSWPLCPSWPSWPLLGTLRGMRLLLVLGVLGILGMLGVFPVLRARWLRHLHDDRLDGTRGR